MELNVVLDWEQVEALLRWVNNGDDPAPTDGTDFVYDPIEVGNALELFLAAELAQV